MTYLRDGMEYLDTDETEVYEAIRKLSAAGRTTNGSQIARATLIPRTRVGKITAGLAARSFIHDTSKGAAPHWRITASQPVPRSVAARKAELAQIRRQRELNEQIRRQARPDPCGCWNATHLGSCIHTV